MTNLPFWYRLVAAFLVYILSLNPIIAAAANITVDPSSGKTGLDKAANGVPVVNINKPNAKGLSHNKFTNFNVGKEGVILNNATGRLTKSQLGGYLQNNPNLQGQAAKVILNEVTGTNPSQLKGYTEVLGKSANYILANPHGITCDGCGFINTPRVTLSTGKPVIEDGDIKSLAVDKGKVAIQGLGLNAANVDQFDIITRSAEINAKVHAKQLTIVTGKNTVDYKTNRITHTDKKSDKNKPAFALDSSALGGMYANAITLVGTEQGVGVRVAGDMAATAGNLSLNADGTIAVNSLSASNNIAIASQNNVKVSGDVYAKNTLTIQAKKSLENKRQLASGRTINLKAKQITQQGQVVAGVDSNGTLNAQGQLTINADNLTNKSAKLTASTIAIKADIDNQAGEITADKLTANSNSINNQTGLISASKQLTLNAKGDLTNTNGEIKAETLQVSTNSLQNSKGKLLGKQLTVKTIQQVSNNDGLIEASENVSITAQQLDNQQGTIKSLGTTGNTVITTAGVLDNQQGEIATNNASLTITAQTVNNQQGKITHTGQQSLTITAQQINNQQGELFSKGHYQNGQTNLDNRSGVVAANQVTITGNSHVDNSQGEIVAEQLTIQTTNELINDAGLISQLGDNTQLLSTKTIRNGIISGQQGRIESNATHLTLQAESLENSGDITHVGTGTLDVAIQWLNNLKGKLQSNQSLNVSADSIDNSQGIIGASNVELTTQQALNNQSGLIQAKNNTTLTVGSDLLNQQGQIQALAGNGQTQVKVQGQLDNTHGIIRSENQQLTVNANTLNNQSGNLVQASNKQLTVITNQLNNQQGKIISLGSYQQQGGAIDNQQGFISAKSAAITSASQLDNTQGQIEAEALAVNLQGDLINDGGAIRQVGIANQQIAASNISNGTNQGQQGKIESNANQLTIKTDQLNNKGEINHAGLQLLTLVIDGLENIKGKIKANQALTINANTIDNSSGIIAGRDTTVNSNTFTNSSGLVESKGQLQIDSQQYFVNSNGTVRALSPTANSRLVTGGVLNNQQGTIEANSQQLFINAASLNNRNGLVKYLGNNVTINTNSQIDNSNGKIVADGLFKLTGDYFNNGGGTLYGRGGLDIDVNAINNRSGLIYNHFNSDLEIVLSNSTLDNNNGKILSDGNLQLTASNFTNDGGLIQAKNYLTLSVNDLILDSNNDLRGGLGITINANNLTNQDTFSMNGDLTFVIANILQNKGTLSTLGNLSITAKQLTNEATIAAANNSSITVQGNVTNKGRLTSGNDQTITATNLVNAGTLGSGGNLTLNIASKLTNNNGENGSLIFSAGDMSLFANQIENRYADIYSNGNLTIARNSSLAKNASIINASGLIESLGNINIYTNSLLNKKDKFAYRSFPVSGNITIQFSNSNTTSGYSCRNCKYGNFDVFYLIEEQQRTEVTEDSPSSQLIAGESLTITGGETINSNSLISANKNITITGAKLINEGIQLGTESTRYRKYDGNIKGIAGFENVVDDVIAPFNKSNSKEIIHPSYSKYEKYNIRDGTPLFVRYTFNSVEQQKTGETNPFFDASRHEPVPAQILAGQLIEDTTIPTSGKIVGKAGIQAGGNIHVQVTDLIGNNTLNPHGLTKKIVNKVGNTSASGRQLAYQAPNAISQVLGTVDDTTIALQLGSVANTLANSQSSVATGNGIITAKSNTTGRVPTGSAFIAINPLKVSGFRLPKGKYGLFTQPTTTPKHNYLIETNPAYAEYSTFLSSNYLLNRIGYNEDKITKRLGDGLYETHLIRQAIFAQTGRRFITSHFSSDYDQFKYLMDNAVATKNRLNLSLGVSLTPEQVAALTHDIVWLEEQLVDGHKVLVPVVYLAQTRPGELAADGSLIIGQNINLLSGGNLENVGSIHAYQDLKISAANDILNTGIIAANQDLAAVAGNNIINSQGGQIIANTLALTAVNGSVVNDRLITEHKSNWFENREIIVSDVSPASVIHANQDLKITANRDILNQGSVISSLGNARLLAGNDIDNTAKQSHQRDAYLFHKGHEIKESIRQIGSKIDVKGNLALKAGNDITVVASQLKAGGQVNLTAGNDVAVVAAANEDHYDYYRKGSSSKKVIKKDSVRHQKALVSSGGNTTVKAGGNIQLLGSDIDAKGNVDLTAQGELNALATIDQEYYYYEKKKKGSFGRKKFRLDNTLDQTVVASTIKAGNDLTVTTGGDQEYQAAELTAGNKLALTSGGKLKFTAAKTQQVERHEKSKSSLVWQKAKGEGRTDETLHYTKILAKHPIILKAAEGIEVDVEHVDNATIDQMRERIVQADPSLAWLNTLAERGDVDYNAIRTIHESWDYEHSGLSGAGALVVAIVVSVLTYGQGAQLASAALSSAAGNTVALTATQAAVANAAFTSAAQQFAIGTINNKGNIGAGLKNTFSKEGLKNIASSGISAGLLTGYVNPALGVDVTAKLNLKNINDIKQFVIQQTAEATTKAFVNSAIYGGDLGDNISQGLVSAAGNVASGLAFNAIGDLSVEYPNLFAEGSPQKVVLHAIAGGLISEATGGDFRSGAIAAGANELLIDKLTQSKWFKEGDHELKVETLSQIIGVTAAALAGGDPEQGAKIAQQATRYNYLAHERLVAAAKELSQCEDDNCSREKVSNYIKESIQNDDEAFAVCLQSQETCTDISKVINQAYDKNENIDVQYEALGEGSSKYFTLLRDQTNPSTKGIISQAVLQRNAEVLKEILIEDYGLTKEHAQAATITLVGLGATYFARNYFKRNQKHAGQTSSNHYQTASAYDNRVDFERSYGVNFSNRTEANAAWRVYKQSSRSKEELVIGRLDDTAAREKLGFRRLNDSDWTINVNDAWIQGGIDARKKFYLGSNIDFKNLRTDNPKYPTTVFFRELKQLRDAGYKKVGNYMVPPSK